MRRRLAALAVFLGLVLSSQTVWLAPARAQQPAAGYKIHADLTMRSPDGKTTVEQYAKDDPGGGYLWQFRARHGDQQTLLAPGDADYPAGFRFTANSRWLVRMQKTGSGESTLYLYRLDAPGFVAATAKPLGDLAWDYFASRPETKKIGLPDYHIVAGLMKGTDENYRWMGVTWPDSRYLVLYLSGEVERAGPQKPTPTIYGWQCRYDLHTGQFDVPAEFAANNAKALAPPDTR
jgi:hypothetical protein